jgi:hypothetical protein
VRGGGLSRGEEEQLELTLRHEFTHAIVRDLAGDDPPAWLNEGLATYYELDSRAREERDRQDRRRLAAMIDGGDIPSVSALPESFIGIRSAEKAARAYLIARGFTTWLAERWRPYRLRYLLAELGEGNTLEEALETVYGRDLADLERQWLDSF